MGGKANGLGQRLPQSGQGVIDSAAAASDHGVADFVAVDRGDFW